VVGSVVDRFGVRGWDVAAVAVEASMVEPVDPFRCGVFNGVDVLPRTAVSTLSEN